MSLGFSARRAVRTRAENGSPTGGVAVADENGGIMTPRMAEIFPRRGRAAKKAAAEPPAPADPLEAMASEIRALDAAATSAAERIKRAADQLGEGSGQSKQRVELMGGVATALVDRTDQIRADCERLSSLMDRTAKLVAARRCARGQDALRPPKRPSRRPRPCRTSTSRARRPLRKPRRRRRPRGHAGSTATTDQKLHNQTMAGLPRGSA